MSQPQPTPSVSADAPSMVVEEKHEVPPRPRDDEEEEVDSDDDDDEITFETDDEANAARQVGLAFYNDAKFAEALDIQYAVVRHFTGKYGLTNARCGLYYLDYGLSQLRLIQSRDSSSAAVAPLDQEGLETCFVNLDTARICFEKREKQLSPDDDDDEVQLQLAEVRNAIAQVFVEQENFDRALQEYENEVVIYRSLKVPQPRKLVSAMYGMADCYMKECDFEEAEKRFQAVVDFIRDLPAGTIDPELVKELEMLRDEAKEMKDGKFKAVQELVRQQFLPEEQEVPPPQEVFASADAANEDRSRNPFFSTLPGGEGGNSLRSIPLGFSSSQLLPHGENSNSQSVSHFLPQGNSRTQSSGGFPRGGSSGAGAGAIHHAVVKKKAKQQPVPAAGAAEAVEPLAAHDPNSSVSMEPPSKRMRTEEQKC